MLFHRVRTDAQIIHRVLSGHRDDFGVLVERYGGMVEAVSIAQTGNYTDAEDVAQQAFVKAFLSLDSLREPAKFGAWIRTIARNIAASLHRKRKPEVAIEDAPVEAVMVEGLDPERRELRELLRNEIENLNEPSREILLLFYFSGLRIAKISDLLEISQEAVKKRLQRARAALSKRLTEEIGDLLAPSDQSRKTKTIMGGIAVAHPAWYTAAGSATTLSNATIAVAVALLTTAAVFIYIASGSGAAHDDILALNPAISTHSDDGPPNNPGAPNAASIALAFDDNDTDTDTSPDNKVDSEPDPPGSYGRIFGVVLNPDGEPVPNATVWAAGRHSYSPRVARETTTDESGRFELALDDGSWVIKGRTKDLAGAPAQSQGIVGISPEKIQESLEIRLEEAGVLTGTLLNANTGEPISGADLWLDTGVTITTDGAGRFTYAGIPMTMHYMYTVAPGYETKRFMFDNSLRENANIVLRVKPAGKVIGRVIDESGTPIANASVGNDGSGHTIALQARFGTTNASGYFERQGTTFGKRYTMSAKAQGFEESEQQVITVLQEEPVHELLFTLVRNDPSDIKRQKPGGEALRYLIGTVLSSKGDIVADATVQWVARQGYNASRKVTTNASGRFEIFDAPDGPGRLLIIDATHTPTYQTVEMGNLKNLEVTLSEGHEVAGTILDAKGEPLKGITIIARIDRKWFWERQVSSDAEGRFQLQGVDLDTMTFDFLSQKFTSQREVKLSQDSDSNVITMIAGGAIRGRVLKPDGTPAEEFAILIGFSKGAQNSDGIFAGYSNIGIQYANEDGEFVMSDLPAGNSHVVTAIAPGFADASQDPVRVHPIDSLPDADELVLTLGDAPDIYVQVVDASSGEPLHTARGLLLDRDPKQPFSWPHGEWSWVRGQRQLPNEDGWIHFPNVGHPKKTLVVRAPGYARQVLAVSDEDLVIEMVEEAVVEGTLLENGVPILVGQAFLSRIGKAGTDAIALSDSIRSFAPGQILFDELPSGTYQLRVVHDGHVFEDVEITLEAGEHLDLDNLVK